MIEFTKYWLVLCKLDLSSYQWRTGTMFCSLKMRKPIRTIEPQSKYFFPSFEFPHSTWYDVCHTMIA